MSTAGTNMTAKGVWYIHYSDKDWPATQKFTIFHELFEIIQKVYADSALHYQLIEDPHMSRFAERFAAAVLLPPRFFMRCLIGTGCDLPKLSERLELSHQCLMVAMEQNLKHIPFVGALYDYQTDNGIRSRLKTDDYVATLVVKTPRSRNIKELCSLQPEPICDEKSIKGSLICAAVHGNYPVLYRSDRKENPYTVLVRPLFSGARAPYRLIFLALPKSKSHRFSPQIEFIKPIVVTDESACPSSWKCRSYNGCLWKSTGRLS